MDLTIKKNKKRIPARKVPQTMANIPITVTLQHIDEARQAIEDNDAHSTYRLIHFRKVSPMAKTHGGDYLLYCCIRVESVECTKILLEARASVNVKADRDPLIVKACNASNPELLELLLLHKADPNACDQAGHPPIIHSILSGSQVHRKVLSLLRNGADPNAPIDDATVYTMSGSLTVMDDALQDIFESHGADINGLYSGKPILQQAVISGNVEHTKMLLASGAQVSPEIFSACGFSSVTVLLRKALMMDRMGVKRHLLRCPAMSLQATVIELLATSDEFDERLRAGEDGHYFWEPVEE
jgi:hypothetical protein